MILHPCRVTPVVLHTHPWHQKTYTTGQIPNVSPACLILHWRMFSQQTEAAAQHTGGLTLSLIQSCCNWTSDGTAALLHCWNLDKHVMCYHLEAEFVILKMSRMFTYVVFCDDGPLTAGARPIKFAPISWPSLPRSLWFHGLLSLGLVLLGFDIKTGHVQHLKGSAHGLHLLLHWRALCLTCTSNAELVNDCHKS